MQVLAKKHQNNNGFTLIEIVISMVLVGILVSIAGMGIITGAKGFFLARENAHLAQKSNIAMTRINRELQELSDIITRQTTAPDPYIIFEHPGQRKAIAKTGSVLRLFSELAEDQILLPAAADSDVLIDNVKSFQLVYNDGQNPWAGNDIGNLTSIEVSLTLIHPDSDISDLTFNLSVFPRNK